MHISKLGNSIYGMRIEAILDRAIRMGTRPLDAIARARTPEAVATATANENAPAHAGDLETEVAQGIERSTCRTPQPGFPCKRAGQAGGVAEVGVDEAEGRVAADRAAKPLFKEHAGAAAALATAHLSAPSPRATMAPVTSGTGAHRASDWQSATVQLACLGTAPATLDALQSRHSANTASCWLKKSRQHGLHPLPRHLPCEDAWPPASGSAKSQAPRSAKH